MVPWTACKLFRPLHLVLDFPAAQITVLLYAFVHSDSSTWNPLRFHFVCAAIPVQTPDRAGEQASLQAPSIHALSSSLSLIRAISVLFMYLYIIAHGTLVVNKSYALVDCELPEGRG